MIHVLPPAGDDRVSVTSYTEYSILYIVYCILVYIQKKKIQTAIVIMSGKESWVSMLLATGLLYLSLPHVVTVI